MSEYQVRTAQTAKLPALWLREHRPEPEWFGNSPTGQPSTSTGSWRLIDVTVPVEWPVALNIPDAYPAAPVELRDFPGSIYQELYMAWEPTHAPTREVISGPAEAAIVQKIGLQSSATQSSNNSITSLLSRGEISTSAIASLLVVRSVANQRVLNEAGEFLRKGSEAARAGDLRRAYHGVYHGLHVLMKNAKWQRVGSELKKFCSDEYPVAFGIGAMRFASTAADRIPNWDAILQDLVQLAKRQKVDVRKAFRGLIEVHGAK